VSKTAGLTDHERFIITRARGLAPALRRDGGDRALLAAQLLVELADLAERLAAEAEPPSV
jgi:hypothetical protein